MPQAEGLLQSMVYIQNIDESMCLKSISCIRHPFCDSPFFIRIPLLVNTELAD